MFVRKGIVYSVKCRDVVGILGVGHVFCGFTLFFVFFRRF